MDVSDPHASLVACWLRERVTLEEARIKVAHHWDQMIRSVAETPEPVSAQPHADRVNELEMLRRQGQAALKRLEEFLNLLQPGDELWYYNSPPERWAAFAGENGLAIVRGRRVIRTLPILVG